MIVQAATGAPTNPIDLGFGTNGQLYVLDFGTGAVFHYDANGSPIGAGNGLFLTLDSAFAPAGMAVGPDGNLYISGTDLNTADGQVLQYNATTGAFDKTFISGLSNPGLLAFTAVPEPASASLLTIGALLLARSKRRS
jgi:DNA-binding beta-propeller fold protein YncE